MKYILHKYHENMGENKIIGIKEGCDLYDFISKKRDTIIEENCGWIEISGEIGFLRDWIIVDEDYEKTFEEGYKDDND